MQIRSMNSSARIHPKNIPTTHSLFVLVPASLDRPAEDARDAKRTAALLTPFIRVEDVVVTPIVFIAFLFGGH